MMDNDFPFTPRIISEQEAESFPKHGQPRLPTKEDEEEKERRIKHEKEHGQPAFKTRDEYKARGEKVE